MAVVVEQVPVAHLLLVTLVEQAAQAQQLLAHGLAQQAVEEVATLQAVAVEEVLA
jgi:hypothetical protein